MFQSVQELEQIMQKTVHMSPLSWSSLKQINVMASEEAGALCGSHIYTAEACDAVISQLVRFMSPVQWHMSINSVGCQVPTCLCRGAPWKQTAERQFPQLTGTVESL